MKLPAYINILLMFVFVGCKEPSSTDEVTKFEEGTERGQLIELSNWSPTPQHTKIDSSEIGADLNDAVKVLGSWDQVGDVMGDEGGQYYPFSNRGGYDYIVQIAEDSSINGVWRRPQANILNSEQDAAPNR